MNLHEISIAPDGTHHLLQDQPLYSQRFFEVLNFHEPPGLAPVRDQTGAYHIKYDGTPAYSSRFSRTFGFYFGRATVVTPRGWGHITPDGKFVNDTPYAWAGNYQDSLCTVRDASGSYYHVDLDGKRAYPGSYAYAGDFYNGIAAVMTREGAAIHVNKRGHPIYDHYFSELGVFHKGFAPALDEKGWCHITPKGTPLYDARYAAVEPFYNGFALTRDFTGNLGLLDETGHWVLTIRQSSSPVQSSSQGRNILVSEEAQARREIQHALTVYWETQIIAAGVELGIFELIAKDFPIFKDLVDTLKLDEDGATRLLMALQVLGFVQWDDTLTGEVTATLKGRLLSSHHPDSLAFATRMWGNEHYTAWQHLSEAVQQGEESFSKVFGAKFFNWLESHPLTLENYQKAMQIYARQDYAIVVQSLDLSRHRTVMDVGGGHGAFLSLLLAKYPSLEGIVFDLPVATNCAHVLQNDSSMDASTNAVQNSKGLDGSRPPSTITFMSGNFLDSIPANTSADALLLSRVIHDWNDRDASVILHNCFVALPVGGCIYIIEILRPASPSHDKGVLLNLNMLVITGGKERTSSEFQTLLEQAGFTGIKFASTGSLLSIISASKPS